MSRSVSEKTRELMLNLFYEEGYTIHDIAEILHIAPITVYGNIRAEELGLQSYYEFGKYLAKKRGFISPHAYNKHIQRKRQRRLEYQEMSRMIRSGLMGIEQNQSWLAERIGRTKQAVSLYVQAKCVPDDETFKKICSALKLPYETLDDLLQ